MVCMHLQVRKGEENTDGTEFPSVEGEPSPDLSHRACSVDMCVVINKDCFGGKRITYHKKLPRNYFITQF